MSKNKKPRKQGQKKNNSGNAAALKQNVMNEASQYILKSYTSIPKGYHMMAKPTGPRCNIGCKYCFYLEKESLFVEDASFRMSDEVLEAYIRRYIEAQKVPFTEFVFQGGEPTLMGLDFFKKALSLQLKYTPRGMTVTNSLQTNGTLLDDEWCEFLAKNDFLVGLSIDGPGDIHNVYRIDRGGNPTFSRVYKALKLLQKHRVKYNILACVTRESALHPLKVYDFFKNEGVEFIQFIPIVERLPGESADKLGLKLALPPDIKKEEPNRSVTPWTVNPSDWGDFLIAIFDRWIRNDVGNVFVMNFEWAASSWAGMPGTACIFAPRCGHAVVVEHNGDIYSCDHFVYPAARLGNILKDNPKHKLDSMQQAAFGSSKQTALPGYCKGCQFLFACWGECPKNRFMTSPDGEPGWNYLCPGYKKYFNHIDPHLKKLVMLLRQGRPAREIMEMVR